MTPKDYILSTLDALKTPIVMERIHESSLEEVIYAKVTSKKFRKLKMGDSAVLLTKDAIKRFVAEKKPIRILEMFGGNKLWRFEEAPEIDWAELFSFTYFMQWCRLIANVYEPGVHFEYFSQDICVESMNNVPREQTDRYSKTFQSMLDFALPFVPANIKVSYTRLGDLYVSRDDYYKELEAGKQKILEKNNGKLPELSDAMKKATELNVLLKPGQDEDAQWREKVELEHQAIFETATLKKICDDPNKIWTCPTYYDDSVVTGSTKRSLAKFWAGVGALQPEGEKYAELVITPKQLETLRYRWEGISIPGLDSRNFKKIRILKNEQ